MDQGAQGFEDRVVVVTGGSRGIGREIAARLLRSKARVVICGRKQENLDKAIQELDGGDDLLAVAANVAVEEDVERLFEKTLARFGRVDGLVNNAGMNIFTPALVETELSRWNRVMETNLTGAFLCSRRAGKLMRDQKRGKIVSVSSLAGTRATPGLGVYGVAKAGMEMLTKVLAAELAPYNVQVNAVAPGLVRTDFSKIFWSTQEFLDLVLKQTPAGRIGEPGDIAEIVLFLLSPCADFITGQTIAIDGGSSAV